MKGGKQMYKILTGASADIEQALNDLANDPNNEVLDVDFEVDGPNLVVLVEYEPVDNTDNQDNAGVYGGFFG